MTPRHLELAELLASPNPLCREEAETRLRAAGPDAGDLLLEIARELSCRIWRRRAWRLDYLGNLLFGAIFVGFASSMGPVMLAFAAGGWFASVTGVTIWQVTAANRAFRQVRAVALTLAVRDYASALGPLLNVWEPLRPGFRRNDEDTAVEAQLVRLLPLWVRQGRAGRLLPNDFDAAHGALTRLFRWFPRGILVPHAEFPDACADVALGLLQVLALSPNLLHQKLLRRVAQSRARTPNQSIVREAARLCLGEGGEVTEDVNPSPTPTALPVETAAPTLNVTRRGGRP